MNNQINKKLTFRLGLALWSAGMIGVVSTLLMSIPLPEGIELPMPMWLLKVLSLIQPALLLFLAVWGGVKLAPKLGLDAPVFEAFVQGENYLAALRPQLVPGLAVGLLSGIGLVLFSFLTPSTLVGMEEIFDPPLAVRLLYGGITEEVLVRWGLMTFLLWAVWRLFGRSTDKPSAALVWCSIILSSLAFGALHLPIAFTLAAEVTSGLIVYIIGANSVFGILFGYLFWRYGLESSIIAHTLTHLVTFLIALTPLVS